jgi:acetyl esterase/lipase
MLEVRNQMTETNSRSIGSPIPAAGENRRSQPGWRSARGVLALKERLTTDYWRIRFISLLFILFLSGLNAVWAQSGGDSEGAGDDISGRLWGRRQGLPQGVRVLRDIPYGCDRKQRMDVYIPPHPNKAPVLFMVHGGAWRFGDKAARSVVENKVARWGPLGFIFISANNRLLPGAGPLQQAEDVARALAVAQAKAASWGGDPAEFILMGHSAGAHLVNILASDPSRAYRLGAQPWLGNISLDTSAMNVVKTMQGRHYWFFNMAFGRDAKYWKAVSPSHLLSADARPMLLVCSSLRSDNPCVQAHDFAAKAASLGVRVEVLEEPLSHGQINKRLGTPGAYTDAVESFMQSLSPAAMKALANRPARIREACADDFKTFCSGVQPGGGRIIACLRQNFDKLSPGCRQALTAAR